jgi:hypothetical protein
MRKAVARHDQLLRGVVADPVGSVFATMGDGLAAAFPTASAARSCADQAQRLLDHESWRLRDTYHPTSRPKWSGSAMPYWFFDRN